MMMMMMISKQLWLVCNGKVTVTVWRRLAVSVWRSSSVPETRQRACVYSKRSFTRWKTRRCANPSRALSDHSTSRRYLRTWTSTLSAPSSTHWSQLERWRTTGDICRKWALKKHSTTAKRCLCSDGYWSLLKWTPFSLCKRAISNMFVRSIRLKFGIHEMREIQQLRNPPA